MTQDQLELPDKLYFKIGEVAKPVGVKPYVLRYWETEFSVLRPGKNRSQHRLYRRRDVETLLEIKRLLHKERFTIEGAKRYLRKTSGNARRGESTSGPRGKQGPDYRRLLGSVKRELQALCDMLS